MLRVLGISVLFVQNFAKQRMLWTSTCLNTINKPERLSGQLNSPINHWRINLSLWIFIGSILVGDQNEQNDQLVRSKMRKLETCWTCLECPFQGHGKSMSESLNNTYRHIESNHVDVSFLCVICFKQCKNRSTLLLHRSRYHRNR